MNNNKDLFFSEPYRENKVLEEQLIEVISDVIQSGNYILGENVSKFESEFAEYIGVRYCISVNSGTDALIFALRGLGITYGDEIIVPSLTATATISAIVDVGATPIFVDVDESGYTLDVEKIGYVLSEKTRAIVAVHLYGNAARILELKQICDERGLYLIEDVAQACGAEFNQKKLGSFGHISCFSFYPTKNLGAIGDGGAICTNDPNLAESMIAFRQYGWDSSRISKLWGRNSRLDEIQAATLRVKLKYLDQFNRLRREMAEHFDLLLDPDVVVIPKSLPNVKHVFHLYVIRHRHHEADFILEKLAKNRIFAGRHYASPTHTMPNFARNRNVELPITEKCSREVVSLQMFPYLELAEVERVCEIINDI